MRAFLFLLAFASAGAAASPPPDWTAPAPGTYPEAMAVTGVVQISGVELRSRTSLVAAFVDGEVRGVTGPTLFGGRRIFQLSIAGDSDVDGAVSFKVYDAEEDRVLDLQLDRGFDPLSPVGTLLAPIVWTPLAGGGSPAWDVDPSAFPASMIVRGQVVSFGEGVSESGARVGAFLGGELRGSAPLQGDPALAFLTVYGADTEAGDLDFRVYLPTADRTFATSASVPFATGTIVGAVSPVPIPIRPGASLVGPEGWEMLAAPGADATVGTVLARIWTQGFPGASASNGGPNVFHYSEPDGGYVPVASASEAWPRGEGRFVYVYEDDNPRTPPEDGGFPKTLDPVGIGPSGPFTFGLTYSPANGETRGPGWNLLGNPFDAPLDWDLGWTRTGVSNSVYVWDPGFMGGGYRVWNGSEGSLADGVIPFGAAFWVQASTAGAEVRAPSTARVPEARSTAERAVPGVALHLASAERPGLATQAWVTFQDGADDGLDVYDAWVLTPLVQDYVSLGTATMGDGRLFAIDARGPTPEGLVSIPLGVGAVADGLSTSDDLVLTWPSLTVPEEWTLTLVDTETGERVDLRATDRYAFTVVAGESRGGSARLGPEAAAAVPSVRFHLEIATGFVTASEQDGSAGPVLDPPLPNPARGHVTFSFRLSELGEVRFGLYDVLGRRVAELADGPKAAGLHSVEFDARAVPTSTYVARLDVGGITRWRRVTILQ